MESRIRRKVYVRFGGGDTPYPQGSTVPTLQTLVQTNATISKTLAVMEAQQAAWQRADTVDRMSQAVIKASLNKIEQQRWETWPKW